MSPQRVSSRDAGIDPDDTYAEPASAKALYGNHGTYVARFTAATLTAQRAGYILAPDAFTLIREAAASDIAR